MHIYTQSGINDHSLLETHIRSHRELVLSPPQHLLYVLVINKPRKVCLLLTLLEQSSGIVHQNNQMSKLQRTLLVLYLFCLDSDV
jgi:hypothetical protein